MENAARIIITLFFIGLIALAIIFFGVFGILPLARVGKHSAGNSTSTVVVINEQSSQSSTASSSIPQSSGEQTPPASNNATSLPSNSPIPSTPPPSRVVRIDAPPGSPDAPQQSNAISESQIPQGVLRLMVKDGAFNPSSFAVKSGDQITIYFTSADGRTHSIGFEDASVQGIAVGVGPGETRSITFKAPAPGTYAFECNVPGHAQSGEQGTMVVQ